MASQFSIRVNTEVRRRDSKCQRVGFTGASAHILAYICRYRIFLRIYVAQVERSPEWREKRYTGSEIAGRDSGRELSGARNLPRKSIHSQPYDMAPTLGRAVLRANFHMGSAV